MTCEPPATLSQHHSGNAAFDESRTHAPNLQRRVLRSPVALAGAAVGTRAAFLSRLGVEDSACWMRVAVLAQHA